MSYLKKLFDFYLNSSIHVALAVFSFVKVTEIYYELAGHENLSYFIFFATITGYNFVKYFGIAKFHHRSLTKDLKVIQVFSLLCFLLLCFFAYQLPVETLVLFIPFGFLTVLYAVPFLSGLQKNLRTISYLKIIIVALVWAGTTVLLPLLNADKVLDEKVILYIIQRFLIVAVLILPFDIRDIQYDAISLQTIPKKIGIKNTKKLGFVLLLFALVIEFLIATQTTSKNIFLGFSLVTLLFLMRAKENQSNYYSSFFVESLPIIWWIFLAYII
ncbi:UbiA prenyltransferase family protein [Polaribacter gochangensis]|uniref:hypothetical protein n=1 Tax=Polaribacter gochangensis TaxID=3252903 RepID=UPI003904AF57